MNLIDTTVEIYGVEVENRREKFYEQLRLSDGSILYLEEGSRLLWVHQRGFDDDCIIMYVSQDLARKIAGPNWVKYIENRERWFKSYLRKRVS